MTKHTMMRRSETSAPRPSLTPNSHAFGPSGDGSSHDGRTWSSMMRRRSTTTCTSPLVIPNLGAEEGPGWRKLIGGKRLQTVAALWTELFRTRSCWEWFDAEAAAWINTAEAAAEARQHNARLIGAEPLIVRRVNDKAFASAASDEGALTPTALVETVAVLEPQTLWDPETAVRAISRLLDGWPEPMRRSFVLKPRYGCSARGRIAGSGCLTDSDGLRRSLQTLVRQGGAILEPWLTRFADYSAQLSVGRDGKVSILGTLEQVVSPLGVVRGHRGKIDSDGRVSSDSPWEGEIRTGASAVAAVAARAGYHGPCGVDSFTFESESSQAVLRPVSEINARFTGGIVALGHLLAHCRWVNSRFQPISGQPLFFFFSLDGPLAERTADSSAYQVLDLAEGKTLLTPRLFVASERETIDGIVRRCHEGFAREERRTACPSGRGLDSIARAASSMRSH